MSTASKRYKQQETEVISGEPMRSDAEAWAAIGRKLLEESVEVSREYAKFMIQFSFGAIPLYVALVNFVGKSSVSITSLGFTKAFIVLLPVLLYLVSGLVFIFAYYPVPGEIVINVVEVIQSAHQKLLRRRRKVNLIATGIFAIAVLISAIILFYYQ